MRRAAAAFSVLSVVLAMACHTSRPVNVPAAKPAVQPSRDTLVPVASRAVWSTSIGVASVVAGSRPDTEPRKLVMLDAFVPAAQAMSSGGICNELSLGTSKLIKSVSFPNSMGTTQSSIMLTADSSGRLERYTERRGMPVIGFVGFPSPALRDSVVRAARAATRSTTIELDYESGAARLVNEGGGLPYEFVETSVRNVEHLEKLGKPGERAKWAVALCGGLRPVVKAPPPPPRRGAAPAIVLRIFFDAVDARAWSMAASLLDDQLLTATRVANLQALIGWARGGAKTYSTTAVGAGSFQDVRFEPAQDTTLIVRYDTVLVPGLGRPITLGQLGRLPPRELAALELSTQFDSYSRGARRSIIGTVVESDSIAHVLFRTQWNVRDLMGIPLDPTGGHPEAEVAQLRRSAGEWRLAAGAGAPRGGITLWNRVVMSSIRR